jgi:hypothetical protein
MENVDEPLFLKMCRANNFMLNIDSLCATRLPRHYTMDNVSSIPNLSNWTLSLIIGIKAALTSGAQKNIVGELPFSDLLLTIPPIPNPGNKKNETVLISKQSQWATILHKSFWMKGLESLHITVNDDGMCPKICSKNVAPNMFYGLLRYHEYGVSVCKRDEIEQNEIDPSAYMYLGDMPKNILRGKTNRDCIVKIKEFIRDLQRQADGHGILDQIMLLIDEECLDPKRASEVVDRISGRIIPMCKRLNVERISDGSTTISVDDLVELITVALGISRALAFSDSLHMRDAIIIAGFNIGTAHEILSDMTEVPSEEQVGFSTSSHLETSQKARIVDRSLDDNKTLMMPIIEVLLTVAILYLSKIGPLLSMYVCRQSLAPYRESMLKRGSSMRWSISNIKLYHTGCVTSRDDWLMSITRAHNIEFKIHLWRFLLVLCCAVPFGLWKMWGPDINPDPDTEMQHILSIVGLAGGITWLTMSIFTQTEADKNKDILEEIPQQTSPDRLMYIDDEDVDEKLHKKRIERLKIFLLLLIPITYVISFFSVRFLDDGSYSSWVYNWIFEVGVGMLWITGELLEGTDMGWIIESTSFYMMGILSAVRLV